MSDWIQTYDSNFFIAIATVISASFALCLKFAFKSKCENMSICYGLLSIKRNVTIEKDIEIGKPEDSDESTKIHKPVVTERAQNTESHV